MAVSNEVIIDRMVAEIQKAKTAMNEQNEWKLHIAQIQLLSELLLESQEKEMEAIATPLESKRVETVIREENQETDISIFDF